MRNELAVVAAQQSGLFTTAQAAAAYSPKEVRTRVHRGEWCRVFHGVFREASSPDTPRLRVAAAGLRLGCTVVACRGTAAQLHGFDILDDGITHVLSARKSSAYVQGMMIHRDVIGAGDCAKVDGLWATNPVRTAVDVARLSTRMDSLAVLDAVIRHGIATDLLTAELAQHSGRRGFRQARELLGYANGKAESPMESRTLMRCIDAGLPIPEQQLYVPIPFHSNRWLDLGWRRWKIGLEYDSTAWHSGDIAASRDNPRHNWLTKKGWTMYYATPRMVYRSPEDFTGPIAEHIADAVRRER